MIVSTMGSCVMPDALVRLTVTVPLKMGPVGVAGVELPPQPVRSCVRPRAEAVKANRRSLLRRPLRMRRRRANGKRNAGSRSPAKTMPDEGVCS